MHNTSKPNWHTREASWERAGVLAAGPVCPNVEVSPDKAFSNEAAR